MKIKITLYCPDCRSTKIKKNGNKPSEEQNYMCKDCGKQFTADRVLTDKSRYS